MSKLHPKMELHNRLKSIKAKKLRLLQERQKYIQDNLIEFFDSNIMKPNPPQRELLNAWMNPQYKVFTYTGANRIGKTTIGAILAISTMIGRLPWNGQKLPIKHSMPRKIRYIGQDWEKHIQQVVVPALKKWWPKKRKLTTRKNNLGIEAFWQDDETGSVLEIMSNKQESELHEGWDGDLVIYDEPPRREIRVANARGLIDREGRELFCMTLLKEAWVDREVIKATNPDGTPDTTVFNVHGDIWCNVGYGITEEGVRQFEKTLKPEEKEARLRGIPSYMSGLIFPQFKRETHIIPRPKGNKIPLDWIVDIAIDFHPSKPWAVLFMATDCRNFKYCIDEIYETGSWKYIGEEIVRRIKKWGVRVNNIIIDPLAKGDPNSDLHEQSVFDKLHDLLYAYGYLLSTASKDKEGGIHIVQDLLMTENQMPALFFFDSLKRTIYEIEGWMYGDDGKPVKKDDEMMENLYRLCLLNTEYEPLEDEDESDIVEVPKTNNSWTGY